MTRLVDKITGLEGWRRLFLAFFLGLFSGVIQAPWSFPYVLVLTIPVLYLLYSGATSRRVAGLIGWFFALGYFGLTLSWIVEPFLVDFARHGWMAPFALLLMAGGLGLFWALAFAMAKGLGKLGFVALWSLSELARAYVFTGFPWSAIGYGWVDTPIMQVASLVGVHGVGFFVLLAMLMASDFCRKKWQTPLVGIIIFGTMWGYGAMHLSTELQTPETPYVVRLLQPNAAQELKWLPEFTPVFYQRQLDMSAAVTDTSPDLIVWPESAVPFIPERQPELLQQIAMTANGASTVLGARHIDAVGNWYNGLVALDTNGEIIASYKKHHLVPFGEYIPFSWLFDKIGLVGLTGTGFSAGEGPVVLEVHERKFIPLICYEAIFPHNLSVGDNRPSWILQVTNDAWFGNFSGPYQHLAQARVRAIEQGLPFARSANTGVSAMIDPYGRVTGSLILNRQGFLDAELPLPLQRTFYSKTGDWIMLIVLMLSISASVFWYQKVTSGRIKP